MKSGWQKYLLYASIVIIGGIILFETVRLKNTGFEGKSLWDWMELFIIPLVLAIGAILLNRSERNTEREIATDRQQEAALQAYLDRMADLLLKEKLRTTKSKEVRNVARIRTLTVLRGLDGKRKGLVIIFLYDAGLIFLKNNVITLHGADMSYADLSYANLRDVNMSGANLFGADLSYINLSNANLSYANLLNADLYRADLSDANLVNVNKIRDVFDAFVSNVKVKGPSLLEANLTRANLSDVNFFEADLRGANLTNANLNNAFLGGAKLVDANVSNEQIKTANL